jgi:hypothetical protein
MRPCQCIVEALWVPRMPRGKRRGSDGGGTIEGWKAVTELHRRQPVRTTGAVSLVGDGNRCCEVACRGRYEVASQLLGLVAQIEVRF